MHRVTYWHDQQGACVQVSVAGLDPTWDELAECTEQLGPFDDLSELVIAVEVATERMHRLCGSRCCQLALFDSPA